MIKKIYITKYVITKGIIESKAIINEEFGFATLIESELRNRRVNKNDYFLTKEEAMLNAKIKVGRRIALLKNQIKKLKKIIQD